LRDRDRHIRRNDCEYRTPGSTLALLSQSAARSALRRIRAGRSDADMDRFFDWESRALQVVKSV
jgi:hypothetical protein